MTSSPTSLAGSLTDTFAELDLSADDVVPFGRDMAKLSFSAMSRLCAGPGRGRIVLVSAMSPTPSGEGKTTVAIGLADALRARGERACVALRQPSLGPTLGAKGSAVGGGRSSLVPADRITLHFTGDFHAIAAAHNLLASLVDHALHFPFVGSRRIDPRRVVLRRVIDLDDRALRRTVVGLGGTANGPVREDGFDIVAASETMAILCLASGIGDLKERLARIVVAYDEDDRPVTAGDLQAERPMAAILRDAALPNLVRTAEGTPAFVHGGPFGNIAHGTSSLRGTRAATALCDYVVTEAGFGFELGAEKMLHLVCRPNQLWPSALVLVVTARALRHHGRGNDEDALVRGLANLDAHVEGARAFGLSPIVAINVHPADAEGDLRAIERACAERGLPVERCTAFSEGSQGATALAARVTTAARDAPTPRHLYALDAPLVDKIRSVATKLYGADDIALTKAATRDLARLSAAGLDHLPPCVAKTHLSLSGDAGALGRPRGFTLPIRALEARAGAGYVLALTEEIMTMPGLPRSPNAWALDVDDDGRVTGLA